MNNPTHESVLNIRWNLVNGKNILQQQVRYADGSVKWINVEEQEQTKEFEARFKGTVTIPLDLPQVSTDPLFKKCDDKNKPDVRNQLLEEYMDKLIKIHALLIRIVGSQPQDIVNHKQYIDFKNNSAIRETVVVLINIIGDPWTPVLQYIK